MVSSLLGSVMSHSSPVRWTASTEWSTSRRQIRTSLLSCSGLVAVPEVTTRLKISINPFSQPTRGFAVMTILSLLQALALVVRMTRSRILPVTGRNNSVWNPCPLMGSSSALASWLLRRHTPHPPSKISLLLRLELMIHSGRAPT